LRQAQQNADVIFLTFVKPEGNRPLNESTHDHARHGHEHQNGHGGHGGHGASADVPTGFRGPFAIGIALNLSFVIVETVYGILAHSMALVADAGHNLSDVLGLGLSWGAAVLARRAPTERRTYGLRGTTIVASLANALVLLFVTGGIAWESIKRLSAPAAVSEKTVIAIALIGVVVNGGSALLFMTDRKSDLNVQSAFLHLASDAVIAVGVAAAGVCILFTGWNWLDPLVSIVLSIVILVSTWSLLRRSMDLVLAAVPEGIDPSAVKQFLMGLPAVSDVHDLHIWAMSTTEVALTAHLVTSDGSCGPEFLVDTCRHLQEKFRIGHTTLQLERANAPTPCRQAPSDVL
jgi:cobalt-zinc-cadmium efflux system protein